MIILIHFLFLASQCKTNACSCAKIKMGCIEFCGCGDEEYDCKNIWNEHQLESDEDLTDDEVDDD